MMYSTVRIVVQGNEGAGASIGTGFFMSAPLPSEVDQSILVLVSNKHVFEGVSGIIQLKLHKRTSLEGELDSGATISINLTQQEEIYSTHPDQSIDLACLNLSALIDNNDEIYFTHIGRDRIINTDEDVLLPGMNVSFVGYPQGRFDTAHNLPLTRVGAIASVPALDFNGKPQFVIDAQVFPGSSGSPVWARVGANMKFVGVVSETMIRHQKLEAIPAVVGPGVEQVLGLGLVLKWSLVSELLDDVVQRVERKRRPEQRS